MTTFLQAAEAVAVSEETRMGLWTLFTKGGWLMWPLLALIVAAGLRCWT